MDPVSKPAGAFLEQKIEAVTIIVSEEYRLTAVASENDVIESARDMNAWFTCHREYIPLIV